jgi:hypothetical protein
VRVENRDESGSFDSKFFSGTTIDKVSNSIIRLMEKGGDKCPQGSKTCESAGPGSDRVMEAAAYCQGEFSHAEKWQYRFLEH